MREKINHVFYYPTDSTPGRKSLMEVIMNGILNDGSISAYADENFESLLPKKKVVDMMTRIEIVPKTDDEGNEISRDSVPVPISFGEFKKFRIKEDWFFDRQRSVLECRIIGISPVRMVPLGEEMVDKPYFWIYFPEARQSFSTAEVFNRQNDAERRTLEDIFWKRQFSSYIYKISNVYEIGRAHV